MKTKADSDEPETVREQQEKDPATGEDPLLGTAEPPKPTELHRAVMWLLRHTVINNPDLATEGKEIERKVKEEYGDFPGPDPKALPATPADSTTASVRMSTRFKR